jgi:ABC-type cobalamin/Fe3+-siderophores transport system ATPase subunit
MPETQASDRRELFDFPSIEFGGTWYLLLRRLARSIDVAKGLRRQTSRAQIRAFFLRLADEPDAGATIAAALAFLDREDVELRADRYAAPAAYSARAPLDRIRLRNFKAIEHLDLKFKVPDRRPRDAAAAKAPSMVILGENATGKSSILEAVALTLGSAAARSALDVSWPRMILDPNQLGADTEGVALRAEVGLEFSNGQSITLAIDRGLPTIHSDLDNRGVPVFAYGAFRRFLSGTRRPAPHGHIRNLFDGSTLSNPEPWLKGLEQNRFEMVIRTLRGLLSVEGEFDVIQRMRGTHRLAVVTSIAEPDGTLRYNRTPLDAVSSGYRSMLAMLCDIMRGLMDPEVYEGFDGFQTARGIVLIDEIEAHLHPRWKVQVMSGLRAALPGMTFIVTTHDPLCLRGMADGEVVVLQRVATVDSARSSRMPIIVEQMVDLPSVTDLRIEQLLTSDFFQLLSSDDAEADRRLAGIGDVIAARARGEALSAEDERVLWDFEEDVASALPVGSSEVHRIVQEAVATYLSERREASSQTLRNLRQDAKVRILDALRSL